MALIDLDNGASVDFEVHKNQICSITFQSQSGETWNSEGKILISKKYGLQVLKSYISGEGITINGTNLIWNFNPSDWNNEDVVYDFSFIRVSQNQRDLKGTIKVNNSNL